MKDKTSKKGLYSKLLQQSTDCCSSENHIWDIHLLIACYKKWLRWVILLVENQGFFFFSIKEYSNCTVHNLHIHTDNIFCMELYISHSKHDSKVWSHNFKFFFSWLKVSYSLFFKCVTPHQRRMSTCKPPVFVVVLQVYLFCITSAYL